MKRSAAKRGLLLCAAAVCAFSFTACAASGKSRLLGAPAETTALSYTEQTSERLIGFRRTVEQFASDLSQAAYSASPEGDNFALSPVSVYMALSLAAQCAGGDTREELLTALGVSYERLVENFPDLYRSLNVESVSESQWGKPKVTSMLKTTNSVWVNEGLTVNKSCIDALSRNFYAYSYAADFAGDNTDANLAVRRFVREQTNGLIDNDFQLSEDTVFTLVNTLYLKDIWNEYGDDLPLTAREYDFTGEEGISRLNLLQGKYIPGRVHAEESFTTFYTATQHGYKLKFLLPNDGYGIDEVFTSEYLARVNLLTDYNAVDEENKLAYYTRCLFPEFHAACNAELKEILRDEFGIASMFDRSVSDFSAIIGEQAFCGGVQHVADLTVNRKGVEGAAVTVIPAASTAAPGEYERVEEDFIVDRSFGFILTDPYGVTLFSGVILKV